MLFVSTCSTSSSTFITSSKVKSAEFTVPLRGDHHCAPHRSGHETAGWRQNRHRPDKNA
jgi:hypothetical protein